MSKKKKRNKRRNRARNHSSNNLTVEQRKEKRVSVQKEPVTEAGEREVTDKAVKSGEKAALLEEVVPVEETAPSEESATRPEKTAARETEREDATEGVEKQDSEWSAEEIEKETETAEDENQRRERPEIVEIEVDEAGERRSKSWLWWLVGGILVLLMTGAIWWAVEAWQGKQEVVIEEQVEAEDEPRDGDSEGEQNSEEAEQDGEKPEEMTEEAVEEKPVEEPQSEVVAPIAARPETSVEVPNVVAGSKLVALTFDDGPSAATTPRLLDILLSRGVKVTFFVLGNMAERAPDVVRREVAEGHEVASHTPYHDQLTKLSYAQVRAQAVEMDRILTNIIGKVPAFTRPPYGAYNATVGEALGQPMILWSVDPRDWADRDASVVCNRVVSATVDGSIVLVHDIHATTVDAVPCIIDNLRAQGFEFVTVSELAAAKDVPLVNGQAYFKF